MLDISDAFAYSQSTNMFMAFGVCSGGGDIELIQNEEVYISRNGFEVIPKLSQTKDQNQYSGLVQRKFITRRKKTN